MIFDSHLSKLMKTKGKMESCSLYCTKADKNPRVMLHLTSLAINELPVLRSVGIFEDSVLYCALLDTTIWTLYFLDIYVIQVLCEKHFDNVHFIYFLVDGSMCFDLKYLNLLFQQLQQKRNSLDRCYI